MFYLFILIAYYFIFDRTYSKYLKKIHISLQIYMLLYTYDILSVNKWNLDICSANNSQTIVWSEKLILWKSLCVHPLCLF